MALILQLNDAERVVITVPPSQTPTEIVVTSGFDAHNPKPHAYERVRVAFTAPKQVQITRQPKPERTRA